MNKPITYFIIVFLLLTEILSAQHNNFNIYPDTLNKKRLKTMVITESALFVVSMVGLYNLWYKEYPQTSFHFINDNNIWRYM
jgi:hypothetical protein